MSSQNWKDSTEFHNTSYIMAADEVGIVVYYAIEYPFRDLCVRL